MAKSFCVDLNEFLLVRPIGSGERAVERKLDQMDLVSVLMDEGFSNYHGISATYHRMWGVDMHSFQEQVISKTLGVPREATVDIRRIGDAASGKYLVKFDY